MRGGMRSRNPEGRASGAQLRARTPSADCHAAGQAHRLPTGVG